MAVYEGGDPADAADASWQELVQTLSQGSDIEATWVSLADAASAAGVSRSALRTWYRSGQIPSRLEPGPHGPQRVVPRELVVERALQSRGRLAPAESERRTPAVDMAELFARSTAEREQRLERQISDLHDQIQGLVARTAAAETEVRMWRQGWRPNSPG